jgi:hypothetical protein
MVEARKELKKKKNGYGSLPWNEKTSKARKENHPG